MPSQRPIRAAVRSSCKALENAPRFSGPWRRKPGGTGSCGSRMLPVKPAVSRCDGEMALPIGNTSPRRSRLARPGRASLDVVTPGRRTAAAVFVLGGLAALTFALTGMESVLLRRWALFAVHALFWGLFLLGVRLVRRLPVRRGIFLILFGAVALQLVALSGPPRITDDYLRYLWDGKVQAAGIDPYRYSPDDPALAGLHDPFLFPDDAWCRNAGREPGCPRLNRPGAPTIYPPGAQLAFLGLHVLSPPGREHKPVQIVAGIVAAATSLLLVVALRRTRQDPRLAVLWAWCPAVVLEAGNNAHIDILAAPLVVVGLLALARRRARVGGALLGLAVSIKLLPLLVFPAALRRRPLVVGAAAAGVLAAGYLPHVLAVGPRVLGFLPAYLGEEGYDGSGRFALLRLVVPQVLAPYVAVAVIGAVSLLALRHSDPDRPWAGALLVAGVAFLVATPTYPWYSLLVVALAVLADRAEWVTLAAAAYPAYLAPALDLRPGLLLPVGYVVALVVVLAFGLRRREVRASLARA